MADGYREAHAHKTSHDSAPAVQQDAQEDLVEPEVIRYPTFDRRQIPALFFPPTGPSARR
jgi:dipeptidyl aminopeptidase/acylaminoacyl peptidase